MSIGKRIYKERKRLNLSQEEVASFLHTTKQAIYKYENNIVTNIPAEKIEKLAELFCVTPQYLAGWEEKEKPVNEDELPINTIAMNRNGKITRKTFTKEQMETIAQMIDAVPEKPKDI